MTETGAETKGNAAAPTRSRPFAAQVEYRVISKGALVRAAAALDSPLLADLPRGTVVRVVEALDVGGATADAPKKRRVRVVAPVAGWTSEKQLARVPPPRNPPDPRRPGD
jgi:hypothetical protein